MSKASLKSVAGLEALVLDKILALNPSVKGYMTVGKITHLASVDVLNFFVFFNVVFYIFPFPFILIFSGFIVF